MVTVSPFEADAVLKSLLVLASKAVVPASASRALPTMYGLRNALMVLAILKAPYYSV
jgi:hypothetical protein